jgi:hypothetical protein
MGNLDAFALMWVSAWLNQLLANKRLGPPPLWVAPPYRPGNHTPAGPPQKIGLYKKVEKK